MHSEAEVVDFSQAEPIRNRPNITGAYTNQTILFCDVARGNTFRPRGGDEPPVPVLAAFGSAPLHLCRAEGSWDCERAIEENPNRLIRSWHEYRRDEGAFCQ